MKKKGFLKKKLFFFFNIVYLEKKTMAVVVRYCRKKVGRKQCRNPYPCSIHDISENVVMVSGQDPDETQLGILNSMIQAQLEPQPLIVLDELVPTALFLADTTPEYAYKNGTCSAPKSGNKNDPLVIGQWNIWADGLERNDEGAYVKSFGGHAEVTDFKKRGKRLAKTIGSMMDTCDVLVTFDNDVPYYIQRKLDKMGTEVASIVCVESIKDGKFQFEKSVFPKKKWRQLITDMDAKTKEEIKTNMKTYTDQLSQTYDKINKRLNETKDPKTTDILQKELDELARATIKYDPKRLDNAPTNEEDLKNLIDILTRFGRKAYESYEQFCGPNYASTYASFYNCKPSDPYMSEATICIYFNPKKVKLVKAGSALRKEINVHDTGSFQLFSTKEQNQFACIFSKNGCEFTIDANDTVVGDNLRWENDPQNHIILVSTRDTEIADWTTTLSLLGFINAIDSIPVNANAAVSKRASYTNGIFYKPEIMQKKPEFPNMNAYHFHRLDLGSEIMRIAKARKGDMNEINRGLKVIENENVEDTSTLFQGEDDKDMLVLVSQMYPNSQAPSLYPPSVVSFYFNK